MLGTLVTGLIGAELGGGLSGSILGAARESVALAAEAEKTSLAFETMLGSADAVGKMIADLRWYAAESPFNSTEVLDAAKQLTAFGIEADQTVATISALGDVAAGVGKPLGQLVNAYGQVATAG